MLTSRYLDGIPTDSRMAAGSSLSQDLLTDDNVARIRALNDIAAGRSQSLAQLALSWAMRDERVTSVLIGASSVAQLDDSLASLDKTAFSSDELAAIDVYAGEAGIDLWRTSSTSCPARRHVPASSPRCSWDSRSPASRCAPRSRASARSWTTCSPAFIPAVALRASSPPRR
jgi:hypothetical protein